MTSLLVSLILMRPSFAEFFRKVFTFLKVDCFTSIALESVLVNNHRCDEHGWNSHCRRGWLTSETIRAERVGGARGQNVCTPKR